MQLEDQYLNDLLARLDSLSKPGRSNDARSGDGVATLEREPESTSGSGIRPAIVANSTQTVNTPGSETSADGEFLPLRPSRSKKQASASL